jgi:DtxR family transcriptional regulator, Mn-dependent transcriptional regulator
MVDEPGNDPSTKMRAYLAEVYRLSLHLTSPDQTYVSTSDLANQLDVSAPAVNRMITRLKELGYLNHERYQGIALTPAGEREALRQLRNHRIAEAFMAKVMGFPWDRVFEEADRISHALSDAVIERMAEMAGQPRFCPHGEPIPDADGTTPDLGDRRLSEIDPGTDVAITRVLTRDPERLVYIQALGLMPDTRCEVLHVAPFNGPIQMRVGDEYRIIGHNLAELICGRPISPG